MGREQAPADGIAGRRVELANRDGVKLDLARRIAIRAGARPSDADTSEADCHLSLSFPSLARPRRQGEREAVALRHLRQRWEQLLTTGEFAITAGARQKARAVIRQAS